MYWPVLESVGEEGGSGEMGPESDSDSEFSLLRPSPRAGLVRHPGPPVGGNSAPSDDVMHS